MYLQKVISRKFRNSFFVGVLKVNDENSRFQDPDPDPLVRGTDMRIRIRTKMSRIRNTVRNSSVPRCVVDPRFGSGRIRAFL